MLRVATALGLLVLAPAPAWAQADARSKCAASSTTSIIDLLVDDHAKTRGQAAAWSASLPITTPLERAARKMLLRSVADHLDIDVGFRARGIALLADLHAELVLADHVLLDNAAVLVLVLDNDELAAIGGNGSTGKANHESGGESIFDHGGFPP